MSTVYCTQTLCLADSAHLPQLAAEFYLQVWVGLHLNQGQLHHLYLAEL